MRKIKYILLFILFVSTSCDSFLEKYPMTSLSVDSFWNTENDLQLGLNKLYSQMRQNMSYTIDCQSADCFANTGNSVSSGTYTPPNTDGTWSNKYHCIRICNDFLENYQKASVTDAIKNRYAGEARFFRAWNYYQLVKRFGDVPLITSTLGLESDELHAPRTPKAKVWQLILDDLDFAVANIPVKSAMKEDGGRVTKGAAQTFLARVALYAGTYAKFHQEGDGKMLLQKAKEAAKGVIDSNEYSLYSDYRNLFLFEGNDSNEDILDYRYTEENKTMNSRPRAVIYDFICEPTKYLADNFLCKDGLPIEKSAYQIDYLPMGSEFENRDPRMALTLWKPGDDFSGKPFVPNLSNQTRTGYMFKKYGSSEAFSYVPSAVFIHEKLIRYAETLLIYAEATYELDNSISDADLDISINTLRDRFLGQSNCLPHLTNAFVQLHQLSMRDEIRRERRSELAAEFQRYDDIIRWMIAEQELLRPILGAKFDAEKYPGIKPGIDILLDQDGFIISQSLESRSFDAEKDYLFPIPIREISLNSQLTQNPGW